MNEEQFDIIERALREDVGHGDVTSMWALPPNIIAKGRIITHNDGILAGIDIAAQVFNRINALIAFTPLKLDGSAMSAGDELATVVGPVVGVLTAERTALNFLQRMSGIATLTRRYVDLVQNTNAVILSTRQTAPGLRLIDQQAVQIGGGGVHRQQLDDMIFIRDSHIAIAGSITAAVERVRQQETDLQVVIEVHTWAELDESLPLEPDRIMLNQMSLQDIRDAVKWVAGRAPLEVSGEITLENVREIAETGVDYVSVSALTQWIKPSHISLIIQ